MSETTLKRFNEFVERIPREVQKSASNYFFGILCSELPADREDWAFAVLQDCLETYEKGDEE